MRRLTGTLLRIAGWMGLLVLFAIAMIAGLRTIAIDDADRAAVALIVTSALSACGSALHEPEGQPSAGPAASSAAPPVVLRSTARGRPAARPPPAPRIRGGGPVP